VAGCGVREEAPRPDVVLVIVDTLRADHMSAYGYERETTPRIDAWFADGRRFERMYATTSFTPSSVASALTGRYPQHHGVRTMLQPIDEGIRTLPGALQEAGYETAGFVSNVNLQDRWVGLGKDFDHYDDTLPQRELFRSMAERTAEATTDAALEWLAARENDAPLFLMVHYIDPHGPYAPPEPKVREFSHDDPVPVSLQKVPEYQRYPDLTDGAEYIDLYDEEIAYADHHIGRLLDEVAARERETVYVLTADHGETLMDNPGWFQHGHHVYEELMRVPLLIRGPGIESAIVEAPVSLVDIAPTLRDLLDVPMRADLDGVSLIESIPPRDIFVESSIVNYVNRWRGLVRGDDKWTVVYPYTDTPELQMRHIDLAPGPGGADAPEYDGAERLRAWLAADPEDEASIAKANREFAERVSEFSEMQENLEALGYL